MKLLTAGSAAFFIGFMQPAAADTTCHEYCTMAYEYREPFCDQYGDSGRQRNICQKQNNRVIRECTNFCKRQERNRRQ